MPDLINFSMTVTGYGLTYLLHSTVWILLVALIVRLPAFRNPAIKNYLWKLALIGGILSTTLASFYGKVTISIPDSANNQAPIVTGPVFSPQEERNIPVNTIIPAVDDPASAELLGSRDIKSEQTVAAPIIPQKHIIWLVLFLSWFVGIFFLVLRTIIQTPAIP